MDEIGADPVAAAGDAMGRLVLSDSGGRNDDEVRKWAELPPDVLLIIFRKIGAVDVMTGAQFVCRLWWKLSCEPQTWRVVDMTMQAHDSYSADSLATMASTLIHRSKGRMEEFYAKNFGDDLLMCEIAVGTNGGLKRLSLISCGIKISDGGLIALVVNSPRLEYLEISLCEFSPYSLGEVGCACPQLKHFRLHHLVDNRRIHGRRLKSSTRSKADHNLEAFQIASYMKELRHLELVGSCLTNDSLHAILDNCRNLESLDISSCYELSMNERLMKKLERIRDLKLPVVLLSSDELSVDDYEDDVNSDFYSRLCFINSLPDNYHYDDAYYIPDHYVHGHLSGSYNYGDGGYYEIIDDNYCYYGSDDDYY